MAKLIFFGPKAPPVSGYANIVASLHRKLLIEIDDVKHISTVPGLVAFLYPGKLWKLVRLLYLALISPVCIFLIFRSRAVYINLNGGVSLAFDLLLVFAALVFRKRIYLHHNSFSYITEFSRLANIIFKKSSHCATHVVSTTEMGSLLSQKYVVELQFYVVSNAVILDMVDNINNNINNIVPVRNSEAILNIGFMGYFDREKGLDLFVKVIQVLAQKKSLRIKGYAVGPVNDKKYVDFIKTSSGDEITFSGPAYGDEFDNFFNSIDVLLFPSRYKNEAEPLIIHHALQKGVPVVATDIGCVAEIISGYTLCACFSEADYVDKTVKFLESFPSDIQREEITNKYKQRRSRLKNNYSMLVQSVADSIQ